MLAPVPSIGETAATAMIDAPSIYGIHRRKQPGPNVFSAADVEGSQFAQAGSHLIAKRTGCEIPSPRKARNSNDPTRSGFRHSFCKWSSNQTHDPKDVHEPLTNGPIRIFLTSLIEWQDPLILTIPRSYRFPNRGSGTAFHMGNLQGIPWKRACRPE